MLLRRSLAAALALACAAAAGCQCGSQYGSLGKVPRGFRNDRESGVAVIGEDYKFSSHTTVSAASAVLLSIASNEAHEYDGRKRYPDFRAYFKPPSDASPADVHVEFSVPFVDLVSGWMFLVGTSPMGHTTRLQAVGEGTRFILEVDDAASPSVHRVYFVGDKGSRVSVFVPPNAAEASYVMKEAGTYLEAYADGTWAFKGPYSRDDARAAFVKSVLAEIAHAHVH